MLITPLGTIKILVDGKAISYDYRSVPLHKTCQSLDGRYAIEILFHPDGNEHRISCLIPGYEPSEKDGPESGEDLELYSFYNGTAKLSIGMEGSTEYCSGERLSHYDYDTEYSSNGVQYCILPITKTMKYVFGVAWIDDVNDENDIQTWFGADPTLFEYRKE